MSVLSGKCILLLFSIIPLYFITSHLFLVETVADISENHQEMFKIL